ncbi:MAG TPA: hypothetical protein DEQ45_15235 [Agrobacterium sp.]|uniref:hypothetical protein n=1 Tax=Rhizobium sp. TaxID=391 RepID=UPI000EDC15DD|nr:hypothetical protein [Agrobacterium sp.]
MEASETIKALEERLSETESQIARHAELEAAARESEAQYRLLFNSVEDGFSAIEVLFDAEDKAYDWKFLKVNTAFEQQTGLRDPVGKTFLALVGIQEPFWLKNYGRIARSGNRRR